MIMIKRRSISQGPGASRRRAEVHDDAIGLQAEVGAGQGELLDASNLGVTLFTRAQHGQHMPIWQIEPSTMKISLPPLPRTFRSMVQQWQGSSMLPMVSPPTWTVKLARVYGQGPLQWKGISITCMTSPSLDGLLCTFSLRARFLEHTTRPQNSDSSEVHRNT